MKHKTYQVTMMITTVEDEDADGASVIHDLLEDAIMEQVLPDGSNLPVSIESSGVVHIELVRQHSA